MSKQGIISFSYFQGAKLNYNENDFIKYFPTKRAICEQDQIFEYSLFCNDNNLVIVIADYESEVRINISGAIRFEVYNVTSIVCERTHDGFVRFLIYKNGKEYPVAVVYIKPIIYLILDLEQTGTGLAMPSTIQKLLS